jgi:hypothetical protein
MLRHWTWIPLLLCCSVIGCQSLTSSDLYSEMGPRIEDDVSLDIDLENPTGIREDLANRDREFQKELLFRTPRGSQVSFVDKSDRRLTGTLLSANRDNIKLMSCISKEIVSGPNGKMQKTSHVPFESLKTSSITDFLVISPPPPNFDSREAMEDGCDYTVDSFVFKSGRRQSLGKRPESGSRASEDQ